MKVKNIFRATRGQITPSRLYSLPSVMAVPLQNSSRRRCNVQRIVLGTQGVLSGRVHVSQQKVIINMQVPFQ